MADAERNYFYWRNDQGVPIKYHVTRAPEIILGEPGQAPEAARENTGQPVCEAGGENTPEINNTQPV